MTTPRFTELADALGFGAPSWAAWRAALAVITGQGYRLDPTLAALARRCLGTDAPFPTTPAREVWIVCGRRAGKSHITAFIASMIGIMPMRRVMASGETPVVGVLARDTRQARVVRDYAGAIIRSVAPTLIRTDIQQRIELATGARVEVLPALQATVRGRTFAAVICDEIAHWWTDRDAAYRDLEILRALRPGLATTGGPLICLSSPWRREGALYEAYARHYGRFEDGVIVWHAPTLTMNPTLPASVIEEARRLDPVSAATEFDAEWRDDVEGGYLAPLIVEGAVARGVTERPPAW